MTATHCGDSSAEQPACQLSIVLSKARSLMPADARLTTLTALMCEIQSSQHSSSPSCHLLLRCRRSLYRLPRAENTCRSALSASLDLWHVELHLEVHVEEVHVELHLEDAEVKEPVEIAEYALAISATESITSVLWGPQYGSRKFLFFLGASPPDLQVIDLRPHKVGTRPPCVPIKPGSVSYTHLRAHETLR